MDMTVRRLGWVVFTPLTLLSWLLSHSLAYRVVGPAGEAHHALEDSRHAYLPDLGLLLAAVLALGLVGFAMTVVASMRGVAWSRVSLAAVGALPPLGFTVQEHLERLLATGSFPATAALEPTFAVGLLLQLPLVAAALFLARGMLAAAKRLGHGLRGLRMVLRLSAAPSAARPRNPGLVLAPPLWPLASRHAPRAPPVLLVR